QITPPFEAAVVAIGNSFCKPKLTASRPNVRSAFSCGGRLARLGLSYKNNRPRTRRSLGPGMRIAVFAIGCLAASFSLLSLASGQDRIPDSTASAALFWGQLYASGGTSLYCGKAFDGEGSQLTISPIYSSKQLKRSLRCVTDRQCTIMNPRYPLIAADLHNHYPALTR